MKKTLSIVLSCAILVLGCAGCKKKMDLRLKTFEKYALKDLQLEKKEVSSQDTNAYYDLDYMIDPNETENKRDHYVQVYSTAQEGAASSMAMIYTDYASADEARAFYDNITKQEEDMLATSEKDIVTDKADNHYLVLTREFGTNWVYDCLYIHNDVILYVTIVIGTSDVENINKDWLKNIEKFFKDCGMKCPFSLSNEIDSLT